MNRISILILSLFLTVAASSAAVGDNFVEGKILVQEKPDSTKASYRTKPLQGIVVKTSASGKTTTTTTDKKGRFKIKNISPERDTIYVALSSESTFAIPLNGDNHVNITLRNDSVFIDSDRIENLTPSYGGTIISRKEMEQTGELNLLRAIALKVAGVQYSGNNLFIRGFVSIRGRNTPLYVINGMHTFDASFLTVWDVESVEVVKGPSASMFGAEAAAGVVVIKLREKN